LKLFGKKGLQPKLLTGLEFLKVLRKTTRSLRIANNLAEIKTRNFRLQDCSITTTPTSYSGHRLMTTFAEIDFNLIQNRVEPGYEVMTGSE